MIDFFISNQAVLLGLGWALCEVLAAVPSIKSNSVFQLVYNGIKSLLGK